MADAERAVAKADSALRTAQEGVERARTDASATADHRERLESQREEARRLLHDLDGQVTAAAEAADAAARVQHTAEQEEAEAAAAADRLREQLEELRR